MIGHMIAHDVAPEKMAELDKGRLHTKLTELEKAIVGYLLEQQRQLLKVSLRIIYPLDEDIEKLSQEIEN